MPYPVEIREKAIRLYIAGYTDEQISENLGISKYAIKDWKKLLLTTGSLEKRKVKRKSGIPYKYKPEKLQALLNENRPVEATSTLESYMLADETLKTKDKKKKKKRKKG